MRALPRSCTDDLLPPAARCPFPGVMCRIRSQPIAPRLSSPRPRPVPFAPLDPPGPAERGFDPRPLALRLPPRATLGRGGSRFRQGGRPDPPGSSCPALGSPDRAVEAASTDWPPSPSDTPWSRQAAPTPPVARQTFGTPSTARARVTEPCRPGHALGTRPFRTVRPPAVHLFPSGRPPHLRSPSGSPARVRPEDQRRSARHRTSAAPSHERTAWIGPTCRCPDGPVRVPVPAGLRGPPAKPARVRRTRRSGEKFAPRRCEGRGSPLLPSRPRAGPPYQCTDRKRHAPAPTKPRARAGDPPHAADPAPDEGPTRRDGHGPDGEGRGPPPPAPPLRAGPVRAVHPGSPARRERSAALPGGPRASARRAAPLLVAPPGTVATACLDRPVGSARSTGRSLSSAISPRARGPGSGASPAFHPPRPLAPTHPSVSATLGLAGRAFPLSPAVAIRLGRVIT